MNPHWEQFDCSATRAGAHACTHPHRAAPHLLAVGAGLLQPMVEDGRQQPVGPRQQLLLKGSMSTALDGAR